MSAPLDPIELLFCPGGEPERDLRRRIRRADEKAAAAAQRTEHTDAREVRSIASDFAHRRKLAPATIDELGDVIRALSFLAMAAGIIERLEGDNA